MSLNSPTGYQVSAAVIGALLADDDIAARVLVNGLNPRERGQLADVARRLNELCTRTAQDRAAAAVATAAPTFAQPAQPALGGGFQRGSKPFEAQYDGRCPSCGDDIDGGLDMIVMTDEGAVHEDCAPG